MIPVRIMRRTREVKAEFGHGIEVRRDGHRVALAAPVRRELTGRFFVSGESEKGKIKARVETGFINAEEPILNGRKLSEQLADGFVSGPGPYVCVKILVMIDPLTGHIGKAESMEIVCSPEWGARGAEYLHPLAVFGPYGKDTQLAYHDYKYTARLLAPGRWAHYLVAA